VAVVLDSSAVVGFLDRSDRLHAAADRSIRQLLRTQQLFVSVITYAEVLTGARLGHHEESTVAGFFADLITRIVPVEVKTADRAATLRAQSEALHMPDALIVACAELEPGVELLLSGDRHLARLEDLNCDTQLLDESG
jgi:predicted nucleic acid-binding protein